MTSCSNCNNVLPRTVDQCPVCGHAVGPAANPAAIDTQLPGWASGNNVSPTPRPTPQFAQETPAPTPIPAVPKPTPPASAGFPPIPGRPNARPAFSPELEAATPRRISHDGVSGGTGGGHAPLPEPPSSVSLEPVTSRSVAATSNRIDANVKIGRSKNHAAVGFGLFALALGSLCLGSAGAAAFVNTDQKYVSSAHSETSTDTDASLTLDSLTTFAAQHRAKIVRLDLEGCGTESTTFGYRTAGNELVTSRSRLVLDTSPKVTFTSGDTANSLVLGWGNDENLALLRLDQLSTEPVFVWGTASRLDLGAELAVLTPLPGDNTTVLDVESTLVVVTDITRNRSTGITETIEVAANQALVPQSVVLDEEGRLVGLVENDGQIRAAEALRASVSEARAEPVFPTSSCPAAPSDVESTD